jgi:hypothetical protein
LSIPSAGPSSPNQIGRYALHFHHAIGKPRAPYIHYVYGCVIERSAKWALAVHDTHFSLFSSNVIFVASGAGLILEDGNEAENVVEKNLVVGVYGTGIRASDAAKGNLPNGIGIATEGSCYWLHGIFSNVKDNIGSTIWTRLPSDGGPYSGVDKGEFGFSFSVFNTHAQGSNLGYNMPLPLFGGSRAGSDWTIRHACKTPIKFNGNEHMGPAWGGLTIWSIGRQAFQLLNPQPDYVFISDFKCWGQHSKGIFFYQLSRVVFNRVWVRSSLNIGGSYETYYTAANTASDYVAADIVMLDWNVQGTRTGIEIPDLRANDCDSSAGCPKAGALDQPQIVVKGGHISGVNCGVEVSSNWDKNGEGHQKGDARAVLDSVHIEATGSCYNCGPPREIQFQSTCADSTNMLTMDEGRHRSPSCFRRRFSSVHVGTSIRLQLDELYQHVVLPRNFRKLRPPDYFDSCARPNERAATAIIWHCPTWANRALFHHSEWHPWFTRTPAELHPGVRVPGCCLERSIVQPDRSDHHGHSWRHHHRGNENHHRGHASFHD